MHVVQLFNRERKGHDGIRAAQIVRNMLAGATRSWPTHCSIGVSF